jgi:hypothetical protein
MKASGIFQSKDADLLGIRWSLLVIDGVVRIDQTNTDGKLFCTAACNTGEPSYEVIDKNGEQHAQHSKKQGPHSLFIETGNLPSSSGVSIRFSNLTSQI